MSDKVRITCDCDAADLCPQGRVGSAHRCSIIRDPQIEADIEPVGKIPDRILDIRVNVPDGMEVVEVRAAPRHEHFPQTRLVIDAVNPAIDRPRASPKPTFEIGKLYRAVNGAELRVTAVDAAGFRASRDDSEISIRYDPRGIALMSGWSDFNLYYGEVEKPKRLEPQQEAINAIVDRLDEAYAEAGRQSSRIDGITLEMQGRFLEYSERRDRADNEIGFLARYLGFQVADGKIVHANGDPLRQGEASIKRIFKVGWVNVYLDAAGPYMSRPWSSKAEADNQRDSRERCIACIKIPDLAEGEGL